MAKAKCFNQSWFLNHIPPDSIYMGCYLYNLFVSKWFVKYQYIGEFRLQTVAPFKGKCKTLALPILVTTDQRILCLRNDCWFFYNLCMYMWLIFSIFLRYTKLLQPSSFNFSFFFNFFYWGGGQIWAERGSPSVVKGLKLEVLGTM